MRVMKCLLLLASIVVPAGAQYDAYGGWPKLKGQKTGFFHTEQLAGRWWLITPDGNVFFAKGVDSVDFGPDRNVVPADPQKAAAELTRQLKGWGFNTAVSRIRLPGMPYAVTLGLASSTTPNLWLLGLTPDYFSPEFRAAVEHRAAEVCSGLAKDPWLIGYYTDNEVRWSPDMRSRDTVLQAFLKKPPESAGYQRAMAFLKERRRTPESVTAADTNDFLEIAAGEYGRVCQEAIRRHDKNHMILGSRFSGRPPEPVLRALGPYYEVISLNNYNDNAPTYRLREMTRISGKPTMLTEFSFKAMDSGLPNTIGAGAPVATQQDRADLYAEYVEDLARLPSCVGYYWFKYRDQPKEGAGKASPGGLGGENSNYGIVKLDGTPWTVLVNRMRQVNAGMEALHAGSGQR